jgi:hypothetical protein
MTTLKFNDKRDVSLLLDHLRCNNIKITDHRPTRCGNDKCDHYTEEFAFDSDGRFCPYCGSDLDRDLFDDTEDNSLDARFIDACESYMDEFSA